MWAAVDVGHGRGGGIGSFFLGFVVRWCTEVGTSLAARKVLNYAKALLGNNPILRSNINREDSWRTYLHTHIRRYQQLSGLLLHQPRPLRRFKGGMVFLRKFPLPDLFPFKLIEYLHKILFITGPIYVSSEEAANTILL